MTKTTKSISLPTYLDVFGWNKAQAQLMENWYAAMDATFDSFQQLLELPDNAVRGIARRQDDKHKTKAIEKPGRAKAQTMGVGIVSGGSGGIGTAICRQLAEAGNQIIATYLAGESEYARGWQAEREREGLDVELYECDVTDFNACRRMAAAIEKKHGRIDILVNCAGITWDGLLKKMDEKQWEAVMNTNLDGVFNLTRNLIDGMIKRGYGRIVNISSVNGQKGQFGQTNYAAAKAGMIGFTRSLALEVAAKGITVNCVCPGYVGTSMVEAIRTDIRQSIIDQIPMQRLARTEEVANAVAFLASKDSAYITGTEIAVNGGLWLG